MAICTLNIRLLDELELLITDAIKRKLSRKHLNIHCMSVCNSGHFDRNEHSSLQHMEH